MTHANTLNAHAATAVEGLENRPMLWRYREGFRSLARLAKNPDDTEQALRAAMHLNAARLREMVSEFETDPAGRELLSGKPALDCQTIDLPTLARLPAGTLGHTYSEFMTSRGITPEIFVAPQEIHDPRARYVAQRLRQTHDFWHVVTGYETDVLGEIELQAFMFGQVHTPFSFVIGVLGVIRAKAPAASVLQRAWRAYRRGLEAKPLSLRIWENDFARPLSAVQRELNIASR